MKNKIVTHFYVKEAKKDRNGEASIYLRITVNGERAEISADRKINPEFWDKSSERVAGRSEPVRIINSSLNNMIEEHFKVFIGFKNHVCINLCVSTYGFLDDLRVMSVPEIFNRVFQLLVRYDAEKQINHLKTFSDYSLTESQFAQLVGKSRLYQYLPLKMKKSLDMPMPISDSQISIVGKDYYQDKSFCREESGDINMWKVYNLFTGATKSSYIDTFLDRNVGSLLFIQSLVEHLKNQKQSWFLT